MIIRLATEQDIPACAALDHSYTTENVWQMEAREQSDGMRVSFRRVRLPRTLHGTYPRPRSELTRCWERGDVFLVAQHGDAIAGYLHLILEEDGNSGWVRDLAVAPAQRRRGIGTALLQAAASWLRGRSVGQLLLEMTTKNYPAICLARKLGFSFCGFNDRYYTNQDIALFFAKSLR